MPLLSGTFCLDLRYARVWFDLTKAKIGYEILFMKHLYKPSPLRTLEENEADLRKVEEGLFVKSGVFV